MHINNESSTTALPSSIQLLKSTVYASIAALILLLTIVMPAEYGIDPTGVGSVTGLKRMGEIKMALADEAAAEAQAIATAINSSLADSSIEPDSPVETNPAIPEVSQADASQQTIAGENESMATRNDAMEVLLAPGVGKEIKVKLAKGKIVQYNWQSEGGIANFDVHGDSVALDIDYHNYSRGAEHSSSGELEAAFDGNHGWFWRNRTDSPIVVKIQTSGEYTDIFLVE